MDNVFKLILSLVLPFTAAIIGGFFTYDALSSWYVGLNKPFFSPPNFVFAPVWTFLYLAMGVSFYLVWSAKVKNLEIKKNAIILFFVQLILNTLWSILFFGFQNPFAAFIEICVLWIAIFATILAFAKISKPAAFILIPYILWVSFATILNFAIVLLN